MTLTSIRTSLTGWASSKPYGRYGIDNVGPLGHYGCMAAGKKVNEFSREYPLWYYERSADTCLRTARAAGRRRRKDVDGNPIVRIRNGKVTLTWPQPVAESVA